MNSLDTKTRYPWGNTIDGTKANYWNSGDPFDNGTTPVGYYSASGKGLYDMAGNVWEWCNDWHNSLYYNSSPYENPEGAASGTHRVARGGDWDSLTSTLRSAQRSQSIPSDTYADGGFRCAKDAW